MRSNHADFDLQPQGHFEVNAVNMVNGSVRVNMASSKTFYWATPHSYIGHAFMYICMEALDYPSFVTGLLRP
jgi:hypothetical protein